MTCTPVFVNTHRLLVRGHRVAYDPSVKIETDGGLTSLGKGALVGVGASATILMIVYFVRRRKKDTRHERKGLRIV